MSVTPVTSSRVPWVARSITASDGHRPPGKMYVWIQLAPRALPLVGGVRERDRLEAQAATGPQRPIADVEERPEVLRPDGLEHLDRDDRVVRSLDVAVVAQLDVDEVARPASRTRSRASAYCSREIVIVVTRQPSSPAAYSAKPPHPVPISRTCWPRRSPAFAAMAGTCSAARRRASGPGVSKTALE